MDTKILAPKSKDLGGFEVRRLLPQIERRAVGPFVFFDHMGPAAFTPGSGMDVRPHPHIGLATVTYLFEGAIEHRDSLGSEQLIEPGAINWMTTGRGIVHSERTPSTLRARGSRLEGIQLWVALPENLEETAPSFVHHPASDLPEFELGGVRCKLLLGRAFDLASPVRVHSDMYYLEAFLPKGTSLTLPADGRENGAYCVKGEVRANGRTLPPLSMATGEPLRLEAMTNTHVMCLGGANLGPREMFWNFVSSSKERIEEVKREWARGPQTGGRFPPVPGDEREFIPLP